MEWISVKDRLPPPYSDKWESILIYGIPTCGTCEKEWKVREGRYDTSFEEEPFRIGEYDCPCEVTHWRTLPEVPKKEKVN